MQPLPEELRDGGGGWFCKLKYGKVMTLTSKWAGIGLSCLSLQGRTHRKYPNGLTPAYPARQARKGAGTKPAIEMVASSKRACKLLPTAGRDWQRQRNLRCSEDSASGLLYVYSAQGKLRRCASRRSGCIAYLSVFKSSNYVPAKMMKSLRRT
jgi:hypothetical protein